MSLHATRRTALGGGLAGLLLLTGCDSVTGPDGLPPSDGSTGGPTRSDEGDEVTAPGTEHDAELLAATVAGIADRVRALRGFGGPPPARRSLRPLIRLHEQHLALLSPDTGVDTTPTGPARGGLRARWGAALEGETTLADELADRAVSADSGQFARLLAAMAAAVDQRLAALPDQPPSDQDGST